VASGNGEGLLQLRAVKEGWSVDIIEGEGGTNGSSLTMEDSGVVRPKFWREAVSSGAEDGHLVVDEDEEVVGGFESAETCAGKEKW
jgi:hypothetical protein